MKAIKQMSATEIEGKDALVINRSAFVKVANGLRGKGTAILSYIVDKAILVDGHILIFEGTCSSIAKKMQLSRPVIVQSIKWLEDSEFLIKHSPNVWVINPNIMFYDRNSDNYMDDEDDEVYE